MAYEALFHPAFKKDLKKLSKDAIAKTESLITEISHDPSSAEELKGDLKEVFKYSFKLNKVEYRIAFIIQENNIIFLMVKKRENFYDYLKRRLSK